MKNLKRILDFVTRAEYAVMVAAFVLMVGSYFVAVINRNLIKMSMPWTEEVATYSMVYMALLGTEIGLRDGTQVAVTAVVDKLKGTAKKVVSIFAQIVLEVFAFIMFRSGMALFFKQVQTGQTTPVLKIPMSAMYFSLVLAFGLILVVQAVVLVEKVLSLKDHKEVRQ